jgi:cellobiose phosphorylase
MFFSESMAQAALACKAGKLYLRAFDDEGRPLGNGEGEGAVDSLSQAFSTIVPQGDPSEKKTAVCEAVERLFDPEHNLIKLLDPPFSPGPNSPGYIADYPPGVRENGGQYTHGAIWLAMACFAVGKGDLGWCLLSALLPSARPEEIRKTEDFVLTADVYSHPDCVGQGGWSWYTGAAGWYFQAVLHCMIGLRAERGVFMFRPFIPSEWTAWNADLRIGKALFHIRAERGERSETVLDGTPIETGVDPWRMEGEHSLLLAVPCKIVL